MNKLQVWNKISEAWTTGRMRDDYVSLLSNLSTNGKNIPGALAYAWTDNTKMVGVFTRKYFEYISAMYKAIDFIITTDCDCVNLYWIKSLMEVFGGSNNLLAIETNQTWKTKVADSLRELNQIPDVVERAISIFEYLLIDSMITEYAEEIAMLSATLTLLQNGEGVMIVPFGYLSEYNDLFLDAVTSANNDKLSAFLRSKCIMR